MVTSKLIQRIDIFISSPSDVKDEREIITRVIERLNRLSYIREHYYLRPLAYEQTVPPAVGHAPQEVVDEYMMKAEHCDLFICVMWLRMGTPVTHPSTGEQFQSGTEYEFISAYRGYTQTGKPYILLYRKTQEIADADADQKAKVDAFFRRFEGGVAKLKGLYRPYTSLAEFEDLLFRHIEQIVTKKLIRPGTGDLIDASERPDILEESRRLDVAMPSQTKVNRPTEVWVQICLPDSKGFRPTLPHGETNSNSHN